MSLFFESVLFTSRVPYIMPVHDSVHDGESGIELSGFNGEGLVLGERLS